MFYKLWNGLIFPVAEDGSPDRAEALNLTRIWLEEQGWPDVEETMEFASAPERVQWARWAEGIGFVGEDHDRAEWVPVRVVHLPKSFHLAQEAQG